MIAVEMNEENEENVARHIAAIQALGDDQLLVAYSNGYWNPNLDPYDPLVKAVIEGRLLTKIAAGTERLAAINERSTFEVKRLVGSSLRIERLTKWLVGLTFVLAILTLVLCVDVSNRLMKEYYSQPPPPSAPRMPLPPAR
jgi:hypothetical protein